MSLNDKTKKTFKIGFKDQITGLNNGGKPLIFTVIVTFVVMVIVCLAVFFSSVQGAEKVMVPNVIGKPLTTALIEMQQKELYPKVQLRYAEFPGDEGLIIEQNPPAGAIVKAYRKITITVSRCVPLDAMDNYIGKDIDSVNSKLNLLFGGSNSLVRIANPVFTKNSAPQGTIISQYPSQGTLINDYTRIQFIVSSGSTEQKVKVPSVTGLNIKQMYNILTENNLVFDFTSHNMAENEKAGTVTYQSSKEQNVNAFSHINIDLAFAPRLASDENVYGILEQKLPDYPFPVTLTLKSKDTDNKITTLVDFNHPGKVVTIPYYVKKGSVLTLYVNETEYSHITVE